MKTKCPFLKTLLSLLCLIIVLPISLFSMHPVTVWAAKSAPGKFSSPQSIVYPILQYEIPEAERIALDNGMVLFLLENHELPLVKISAVIRTGSAYDPPDQAGLAELTCRSMRTGGTASLTGNELDDRLDRYAINIWTKTDMEMARFGLNTLKENLELGVDLFSQMLNTPRFHPDKVRIEKELLMENLRRIEDDPQDYAFREYRKQLYRGNPRGNQSTVDSVEGIIPTDLVAFHRQYFYSANIMLTVTGDINREEAIKLLAHYFPPSPQKERPAPLPTPNIQGDGRVILIPKATPQSIVLLGFPSPPKTRADYYAFSVLDFVLGSGGFQSRIFQEIRNNLGLAYSAGSFYKAREDYGVFSAYAMTKSEATMKVLDTIKDIIETASNSRLSPEEIRWAKKSITNSFLFSFVSAEQIAYQQLMLEYERLPADFLKRYREQIQRTNPAEIQAAAGRYLSLDQAIVLILGDETKFDGNTKELSDQSADN